jgi:Flp pilus assembly protein TadD
VDEATKVLTEAVALRPSYAPAHNNLGVAYLAAGDFAKAATELALAVHHAPRVAAFHENLGVVYFRLGKVKEARAEFAAVVELDKSNTSAAHNLRWLDGLAAGTIHGTELPFTTSKFAVDELNE